MSALLIARAFNKAQNHSGIIMSFKANPPTFPEVPARAAPLSAGQGGFCHSFDLSLWLLGGSRALNPCPVHIPGLGAHPCIPLCAQPAPKIQVLKCKCLY